MMTKQWEQSKVDFKKKIKIVGRFTDKRKSTLFNHMSHIKINNGNYDATDGYKLIRFKPDIESVIIDGWMDQDGNYLDINSNGYPDFNRILFNHGYAYNKGYATKKEIKELLTFINRSTDCLDYLKKTKQDPLNKYYSKSIEFQSDRINPFYIVNRMKFEESYKGRKKTYKEVLDYAYSDFIQQEYKITGDYSPFKGIMQGLQGKSFNLDYMKDILRACMISEDDEFCFFAKYSGSTSPIMIQSESEDVTMLLMPTKIM